MSSMAYLAVALQLGANIRHMAFLAVLAGLAKPKTSKSICSYTPMYCWLEGLGFRVCRFLYLRPSGLSQKRTKGVLTPR